MCSLGDGEVLHRIKVERNVLHTTFTYKIAQIKADWVGHILRRNSLLRHAYRRNDRKEEQLLNDLTEKRRYGNLKTEAVDCSLWRILFGRGCGPVARQVT